MNIEQETLNNLRITERNYKDLFIQSPAPIAIYTGPSLVYTFVNEAYLKIFNHRKIIGKTLREAFPELEGQPFYSIIEEVFNTGAPYTGNEIPAVIDAANDGVQATRYYNLVYTPYRNEEGEIEGVMATGYDITDQVQARQKIAESEERLRIAIHSADMGTWDYNPATKIIYCSERTKELFGFERDQEVDLALTLNAIVETDRERVVKEINNALDPASNGSYEIEYSVVNVNTKKERSLKARGKAFFENGIPSRMVGTVLDISHEVQLKKEQQKLLCLIENAADFMALADIEGKLLYLNKEGQKLIGLDLEREYNPNLQVKDFYTREHFEKIRTTVITAVLKKGSWSGTIYLRHFVTREIIPCHANYIAIKDPVTAQVIGRGVTIRDLRAEIAAQKALAESEKNLRTLIMQAPVGIGILRGEQLAVELANDAYLEVVGRDTDLAVAGWQCEDPADDGESVGAILREVLRSGISHYHNECKIQLIRNGIQENHYVDFVYHPLKDVDGTVNGILNIIIDVTDKVLARKKIEESEKELQQRVLDRTNQLEKKNIELEQFTYAASHDMQEPLRKVQIFSNFLLQNNFTQLDEKGKMYLQKVESSVSRMKTLIDDLLDYSRQSKGSLQFLPTDPNLILLNVEADLELVIQQKKATIIKERLPVIIAIPSQINQLFYNLISNALKFSTEKPVEIKISVTDLLPAEAREKKLSPDVSYRQISFADNGIGFEQQYAEQIFSLFKRLHGRSEFEGTGIGLALCKKIVSNHGGIIYATSNPGKGATFNVVLPY